MAPKIDSSKLLPQSDSSSSPLSAKSSSALVVYKKPNLPAIKPLDFKIGSAIVKRKEKTEEDQGKEINNKLAIIGKFFKTDLVLSQRKAEVETKDKEKKDFEEAENKLENSTTKKFQGPSISASLPGLGFLDRVKRFLFFTALGWLLPKILDFLPKLEKFTKGLQKIGSFAQDIFGKMFNGFMSFFSIDLKEKTLGFLKQIPGSNGQEFQKRLKDLENNFDTFVNATIIASVLAGDLGSTVIDELKKFRKPKGGPHGQGGASSAGARSVVGATERGAASASQSGINKYRAPGQARAGGFQLEQARKKLPPVGTAEAKPKGKVPEWLENITSKVKLPKWAENFIGRFKLPPWLQKTLTKLKGGPFAKIIGPLGKFFGRALPFIGAGVGYFDAKSRFESGDKVGGWIASASAALDAFAGLALIATGTSLVSIIGAPLAAFLGPAAVIATDISMVLDVILLVRDILQAYNIKTFAKGGRIVNRYQSGGTATRGGSQTDKPIQRSLTRQRRRVIPPRPPRPKKSQPGKDIGGAKQIKKLYPDPETSGTSLYELLTSGEGTENTMQSVANPYKTLTSTSRITKTIPLIGGIMGSAIDLAMGERPSTDSLKSITMGIGYLADALANQKSAMDISFIHRNLATFSDGGLVESEKIKKDFNSIKSGELIYKIISPIFNKKINEVMLMIKKEVQKRAIVEVLGGEPLNAQAGQINVTSESPDFWLLAVASLFENDNPKDGYQGSADVAQAIYNRVSFPGWPKTIRKVILSPNQFQPVKDYGGLEEWSKINSKESAIQFVQRHRYSKATLESVAAALLDADKQRKAREFVGPRDSFRNDQYEKDNNELDDTTEVTRYNHVFGFEPGGVNIRAFKRNQLTPAQVNREVITGSVEISSVNVDSNNPILKKLATTNNLINAGSGRCTYNVAATLDVNKIPLEPGGTDDIPGNNPRSLQIKLSRSGWVSLPIGRPITLNGVNRTARAHVMSYREYVAAVNDGKIPSGALVFQTEHDSWNGTSPQSHGYDSAIARDGGKVLYNGTYHNYSIYGNATKWVIVWVPRGSITQQQQAPQPAGTLKSTEPEQGTIITIRQGTDGKPQYYLNGKLMTDAQVREYKRKFPQSFELPPSRPTQTPSLRPTQDQLAARILMSNIDTIEPGQPPIVVDGIGSVTAVKGGFLGMGKDFVYKNASGRVITKDQFNDLMSQYRLPRRNPLVLGGSTVFIGENGKYYEQTSDNKVNPIDKSLYEAVKREIERSKGGGKQSGGMILPRKPNVMIPDSYASYEDSYEQGVTIAIQPLIVKQTIPIKSNSNNGMIIFPVPVSVNSDRDTQYNRSRGY